MDPDAVANVHRVLGGQAVCSNHLEDPFLEHWVAANATRRRCDYCDRKETRAFAADAGELGELILEGLHRAWGDFNDELVPWGMGYDGARTTAELLFEEAVTADERLSADLVAALPEYSWVQRDFFRLTPLQRLHSAWEAFCRSVKHESRYFFSLRDADPDDPDAMSALQILDALKEIIGEAYLLREWPTETLVYRARVHDASETFSDAWDLGAVPLGKAERAAANRMSPAGIPMFYGSRQSSAAAREAAGAYTGSPEAITVATFELVRPLQVIDLSAGVEVPSLFHPDRGDRQPEFAFLRAFLADVAKDVTRDGKEHIDYVPTQVVCEYFRARYRAPDGSAIDGIAYPSSQAPGQVSVVLFIANDAVANENGAQAPRPDSERWLGPLYPRPRPALRLTGVPTKLSGTDLRSVLGRDEV